MGADLRVGDSRNVKAAEWELEYEDVFHFKNMYKMIHKFLEEEGWQDPDDGGPNWEKYYYEKVMPHGAKEYRIWWRVVFYPNKNPYVRYFLKLDYRGLNFEKASKVVDGNKYKSNKGNPTINCEAWVQLDYNDLFKNNKLLQPFERFFRQRVYKKYYEQHKKVLQIMAYRINRKFKLYLGLKTYVDEPESFTNPGGAPV